MGSCSVPRTVVLFLCIHGSLAIQWSSSSPQENAVVDACTGDSVSFDWKFTLESGEGLQDIQWFSEDERSNQLVALDDGNFFNVMPTFSQRVHRLGNGGISLSHVVAADAGNYSVQVTVSNSTGTFRSDRKVKLQVADAPCQSSHALDEVKARLTLIEAQQEALQKNLTAEQAELKSQVGNLTDYVHGLETLLTQYHATAGRQVGFHARFSVSPRVASMTQVILDLVTTNQGGAYNSQTGKFTAPYNGTYFFLAGGSPSRVTSFTWQIVVDADTVVCLTTSRYGEGIQRPTCQAVLHLTEGQQVWLKSESDPADFYVYTYFSGFLVNSDY